MSRAPAQPGQPVYDADLSTPARKTAFRRGEFPIAVYGLGKIGLPVAVAFAELTGVVTGVDTDPNVVESVSSGRSHLAYEPELDDCLPTVTEDGALSATTDGAAAARDAAVHIVVVPVPLDEANEADLSAIDAVIDTIAEGLAPGDLVVVETTVPPGTAAERVRPRLAEESGLAPTDFGVAVAPERTSSGRALTDIRGAYPRVVGGVDDASTDAAFAIYDELVDNHVITVDARTAEAVKLFEGVYRDVNIALANELAYAFDDSGIDVREAIDVANTQPYCDIHEPGAGVGGHCIPWYPHFLMDATDSEMPLVETGRRVNDSMPGYLAERTIEALERADREPSRARVAILGLAYRPEIPETAASPAYILRDRLQEAGVDVAVVDPVLPADDVDLDLLPMADLEAFDPDGLVLVTGHAAFERLETSFLDDRVVIDGRDAFRPEVSTAYTVGRAR